MAELFITVCIWGLSFALAKKALNGFTPFELVTLRLGLGALAAFVLARFARSSPGAKTEKPRWRAAFLLGAFEFAGTYVFYIWALSYLPSGVVGALTLITPVFTFLVAMGLKVEKFSWRGWSAIFLSIAGAALCFPGLNFGGGRAGFGFWLLMLSNLSFAIGNVLISKWETQSSWSQMTTAQGLLAGAAISALVCAFTPHSPQFLHWGLRLWTLPLYLGLIATGLGFFLWNRGVQKVSATPASVIGNLKAPMSVLWGAVLLDEAVTFRLVLGLVILFSAVLILPKTNRS